MNWKIIFLLSLFGLAMGIATVFVIPSNIEPLFWLVIFVISAFVIARATASRHFLHGLLVGIVNSVWITGAHILFVNQYLANHAKEAAMILELIKDLKQQGEVSIIMIAHNYGQALEVCDRINLLQHGEITFDKLSKDTSVQELNDIVIEEYRRALADREKSA